MTATVRSVRVILEAEVAKYVADMKLAGRATRDAFGGGNGSQPSWISKAMGEVEQSTTKAGTAARKSSTDFDGLGDSVGKTTRRTKEMSLEQAIAAERSSRLQRSLRDQARAAVDAEQGIQRLGNSTKDGSKEIDRMSGRVRLLGEAVLTLGPALIPIGAGLLPAITGIGAAAGAAAGGAGVMVLAFKGVGKAVKALNDYQLEPTKEHLQALNEEMSGMGTSGARFVRFLDSLGSDLRVLQIIARNRMFPGVESGINSLLKLLPEAKSLVAGLSSEVGKLAAEAGAALAGGKWAGFINYVGTDAVPTLDALSHTVGNVALGLANLFVDFAPATRDFTSGMEHASQAFANWTANLNQTQGFQEFLAYVRSEGPQVVDLLKALGSMLLGLGKAAAPIGNVVLPALTDLANILAAIANSPVGPTLYTTAAAMVVVSRATTIAQGAMLRFGTTSAAAAASADTAAVSAGRLSLAMKGVLAAGAALAAGDIATAGYDKIGGDANTVGLSLAHGHQSKLRSPAAFLGFNPEHFGDTGPVKKADAGLAAMVNAGKASEAAQQLKKYADAANMSVKEASKQFPLYTAAVQQAEGATSGYNSTLKATKEAAAQTSAQIDGLVAAMQEQKNAALTAFDAETQYRQALKDAGKQADTNNKGIRGNSKAALDNRAALSGLAAAWNNQSDAVKNNVSRFRSARSAFISTATAMGVPIGKARELARTLLQIPRTRVVQVSAETSQAQKALAGIIAQAQQVPRTIRTDYIVNQINRVNKPRPNQQAEGGTVPGPRQPYGDKVLTMLAPGEEVITNRNGEADRFRADRAAGRIPGYADGGGPGRGRATNRLSIYSGTDIAGMTVRQLRHLGDEMDNLSSRRLAKLGKALEKATSLQEKQNEAAQTAFDDVKQRREGYASNYTQALTRDLWSGGGNAFTGGYAANSILGATRQLNMQTRDARDMQRLERILRERGVHGGALDQILSGGIDRVRSAASQSTATLRNYETAYDTAQRYTAAAANTGAALLTPEFNRLQAGVAQTNAELKAIHADQHILVVEQRQRHHQNQRTAQARRNTARSARRG